MEQFWRAPGTHQESTPSTALHCWKVTYKICSVDITTRSESEVEPSAQSKAKLRAMFIKLSILTMEPVCLYYFAHVTYELINFLQVPNSACRIFSHLHSLNMPKQIERC